MARSGGPGGGRPAAGGWAARTRTGVAVVDPVPLFRDGLAAMVARTSDLHLVNATNNVHAALALCDRWRPDVVVLDCVLDPRCQLIHLLSSHDPGPAVLVVLREPLRTGRYVDAALAAGAPGIVLRTAEPARLAQAIRRTHRERHYLDPDVAGLAGEPATAPALPLRQPLSRRERQVLQLIADGMENVAVARALFVSVETIRSHVKNILRKLHAHDRAHAVAVGFRTGLLNAAGPLPEAGPAPAQPLSPVRVAARHNARP